MENRQKFSLYLKLPEMRLFWYFLPLAFAILIIDITYMPMIWFLISAAIFIVLLAILLVNSIRANKLNTEVKIERNELKSIISNFSDGLIAYDRDSRILIFNRAAENIFKVKADGILDKNFSPERAKDSRLAILSMVLYPSLAPLVIRKSDPGVYPQVTDMTFKDPRLELEISTDRIVDPNGNLLGFVKVIHNRTREVELMESKSEFIEVAAHQLRTPLTSINWIFESLEKEKLSDSQKELVDMGNMAAANIIKIVNDLLDVNQIEEGKFGYKLQNTDIVAFIENVLKNIMPFANESGIKLYLKKPEKPLPQVLIDYQKLSIALSNLVANAIKYNIQNGEVVVEAKPIADKPYIQISVKDTGIGIPKEEINKLFTKFFRADNAQKVATNGSGLGLYIVKNIINRHGGEVWAESQLNRGSTFYFTLPTDPSLIPQKEGFGEN